MECGNESFSCVLCGNKLLSKELLQEHFRKHANKEIDNKGRPVVKQNPVINVDDDISEINSLKQAIECDVCKMTFQTVTQAIQHKFRKHPESSSKFYCPFCGMQFPLKFTRDKHVQNHQGMSSLGTFPCSDCGVIFHNMAAQQYHIRSVHKRIASMFKPIPTPPPSKKIKINSANEVHSVYYCYLCGTEYVIKFNLQKHLERSHTEEERNSVPTDLIKCTTCDALFYNKKAYDTHNIYHKPDDLYVTSEEQRLQTVTRVDQDFDIRRVQLTAEKFIPSDKPRRQQPKKIESKTMEKPFKSDLDEELSPASSVDSTDDEAEIRKNQNSLSNDFNPLPNTKEPNLPETQNENNSCEPSQSISKFVPKTNLNPSSTAETLQKNQTKPASQKTKINFHKVEIIKSTSLATNSSPQIQKEESSSETKIVKEIISEQTITVQFVKKPEQLVKNVGRKRKNCQTIQTSKESKDIEAQLEKIDLTSEETKNCKKIVKKTNKKRKSPQTSQICEKKSKMATGIDVVSSTTGNDVISSSGNVKDNNMDAISNENNANSKISKIKKSIMYSKRKEKAQSEKEDKNVCLIVSSDSDNNEKSGSFERKSPRSKTACGKKVLKNKNSNTIVTEKSFDKPTSVKNSPRNLRTRAVNEKAKPPSSKTKIDKPQKKIGNSPKLKITKELVIQLEKIDESKLETNSRKTRSQMKSSATSIINSKQKKMTKPQKKKKLC